MRRREKFVVASVILSSALLGVQYVPLDFRYYAVGLLALISYGVSSWALSDDLSSHERLTVVPFPTMYAVAVALFYFLLPEGILSKTVILALFGVGLYALYLTCNIYSVAKGRTIQLLHAAHAVGLLFTLFTSLSLSNTLFSLRLPFYLNGLILGAIHYPLIFMSLWSVKLEEEVTQRVGVVAGLFALVLGELGIVLSFMPISIWYSALFAMSFLYIGLGILHNFFKGRLFSKIITEYSLVAVFVGVIFLLVFPWK